MTHKQTQSIRSSPKLIGEQEQALCFRFEFN